MFDCHIFDRSQASEILPLLILHEEHVELCKKFTGAMVNLVAIAMIVKQILQSIVGFVELKDANGFFVSAPFGALFTPLIRAPIARVFMRHATAESVENINQITKYGAC